MDDLLADDMKQKQNEQATSEVDQVNRQRSNPMSDRGSNSRNRKQQLSELGGDSKGRVSIQLTPFGDNNLVGQDNTITTFGNAIKKRDTKL